MGALVLDGIGSGRTTPSRSTARPRRRRSTWAVARARAGPDGIRINVISPGSILFDTSAWQTVKAKDEEAADVACSLLSRRAAWVSGANVAVDGGQNPPNMLSTMPLPGRWRA